jgi:hypothetical protein
MRPHVGRSESLWEESMDSAKGNEKGIEKGSEKGNEVSRRSVLGWSAAIAAAGVVGSGAFKPLVRSAEASPNFYVTGVIPVDPTGVTSKALEVTLSEAVFPASVSEATVFIVDSGEALFPAEVTLATAEAVLVEPDAEATLNVPYSLMVNGGLQSSTHEPCTPVDECFSWVTQFSPC